MQWEVLYGSGSQPRPEQIIDYIQSPLWAELCGYLEETYGVPPKFEFSSCAGKPGWNVKYKKTAGLSAPYIRMTVFLPVLLRSGGMNPQKRSF